MHYLSLTYLVFLSVAILLSSCETKSNDQRQQMPAVSPQKSFAFVISDGLQKEDNDILLYKQFPPGMKVTLLETHDPKYCISETYKTAIYEGEANSISYTRLAATPQCGPATRYFLAVLGSEIKNYEIIKLQEILDKSRIAGIDEAIRKTDVLKRLLTNAQDSSTCDLNDILDKTPKIYRYPIPNKDAIIVSYTISKNIQGPTIVLIDSVPYPLTGWYSYPYLRTFSIDGEYYVESGSSCCDCGITAQELFKISEKGPILIYADSSLSN